MEQYKIADTDYYQQQINSLKKEIFDLKLTIQAKDTEILKLTNSISSYKLLLSRSSKEKKDIKSLNIKEKNLTSSPPRIEKLQSSDLSENEKKYLDYQKKFEQLHQFQKEIIINIFKQKYSRDYSVDFKKFCYIAYIRSPRAYQLFETIIPLPCYKTLYNTFNNDINEYKAAILNVDKFIELLREKEKFTEEEFIPSVLSIDAFTTTIFKKNKIKENNKYCFIFQMQPFLTKIKTFIEHLHPSTKGNATKDIDEIIRRLIHIPSKFKVLFISVDGDLHYDAFFKNQFDRLLSLYGENDISNVFDHFLDFGPIFSSDFLHIDKNERSILLNNKCIVNPFIKQKTINSFEINQLLKLGDALTDRSNIGKMRDLYPIQIFTIRNSLILLDKYSKESFFYFIVFGMWTEGLLNEDIVPTTRIFLINTVVHIFIKVYKEYSKVLPENVSFKNRPYCRQLFVSINKLYRIIPTLFATSYALTKYCDGLGIDRLTLHPCENRIGNIRCECNGNHSMDNVLLTTCKHEFLKGTLKQLQIKEERHTRLNLGGCKTCCGSVEFHFVIDYVSFAEIILKVSFYKTATDEDENFLFDTLNKFQHEAPFTHASNISVTSNISILNRLYMTQDVKSDFFPYYQQHLWSSNENKMIRQLILNGDEVLIYQTMKWIPYQTLFRKVQLEKDKIFCRPLEHKEMPFIQKYMNNEIGMEELLMSCSNRTKESLEFLIKNL